MADCKSKDLRTRNFASVVYPDSAPADWLSILSSYNVECFVSPLHDQDYNPDGELKKPHYHVLVMFPGKKSESQVNEFFSSFGAVGREDVVSVRGYARYLCHLDNPEKHKYPPSEVLSLGGADYLEIITLAIDRLSAITEMMAFCREEHIIAFADLCDYAALHKYDWFRVLCNSGAVIMKEYIKSNKWRIDQENYAHG